MVIMLYLYLNLPISISPTIKKHDKVTFIITISVQKITISTIGTLSRVFFVGRFWNTYLSFSFTGVSSFTLKLHILFFVLYVTFHSFFLSFSPLSINTNVYIHKVILYKYIDFLQHILLCSPTILILNRKLSLNVKQL